MRTYAFGPYRLDVRERQLLRGGEIVPLPPKLFDLLAALLENSGRLVPKGELLERVWSEAAVEEGSLTRSISSLRQILGTPAHGGEYIQTVPKHGYRFTAPVQETAVSVTNRAVAVGQFPLPPQFDTPATAFVGRDAELAQMHDVWRRAMTGRHQLLLVAGEPGIGKTRLAWEFARARYADAALVLAGCSDEEGLVPYQPFMESLGWYFRVCPEADLRARLAAAGGAAELGPFLAELRTRISDLPTAAAMGPEGQRYRLFQSVAALLATVSRAHPLLLVFDDLHWADEGTLLLLRHVMRASHPATFAVLATYRESELGRTHPLAEMLATLRREASVTRIALRGLEASHIRALVDAIAGSDASSRLARLVMDSTDGNPFFATEMLRHLKETGAIRGVGDDTAGRPAASFGLSESIKEVIGRRVSRLSEACNRALAVAAVIGREFDFAVVQAVLELEEDALLDALEEAMRAQLVAEPRAEGGRFAFMHATIRETLYSELSSPRRVRLHRRIAEALERLAARRSEPPLAELAYHFTQASSGGAAEKAIEYARQAGDRAADALAHEEAARLFEMALHSLEFVPTGPEVERLRVDLHRRRAGSFDALGQWALEIRELEAALRSVDPDQLEARCELLLALAQAWFLQLDIRPVERYATEALELGERLHRSDFAANALGWLARSRQSKGDLASAIDLDRRAIARAPGVATAAHMLGPLTLYLAGRLPEALALATDAAAFARSSRDTTWVMYALSHLGLTLAASGRYAEASTVFHDVRGFGRKYGALPMLARATAMAAGLHLSVFDFEGAEALQAEACEVARSVGFAPPVISAGIDSLLTFARCHEPGRAERLLDQTAAAAASTAGWHEWLWEVRLTQARAELAIAQGASEEAVATATKAIELSRARGRPKYESLGFATRARGLQALARTRHAIVDARSAVRIAERTGDPALLLLALDVLITLDGTDALALQARILCDRVHAALGDDVLRRSFADSEVVRRLRASA